MLYEHKERSDGCVEEVSVGLLLAQRGLAKYADYESATYAESDTHTEESCEYEEKTLEFQESDFKFTSEALETSTESKRDSSSTDLLDKILPSDVSSTPAKQLIKPSELTAKAVDDASENCDSKEKHAEPSTSSVNEVESSSPTTNGIESRDRKETPSPPVTSDHVTEVTSADINETSAGVNKDSVESAV